MRKTTHRISRDDVWPLRCADGRTFAERHADKFNRPTEVGQWVVMTKEASVHYTYTGEGAIGQVRSTRSPRSENRIEVGFIGSTLCQRDYDDATELVDFDVNPNYCKVITDEQRKLAIMKHRLSAAAGVSA